MIAVVMGGAASGKSEVAEQICLNLGSKVAYIATMQPFGKDAEERIKRHHALRSGKGFATIEHYWDIGGLAGTTVSDFDTLLIECMSNLLANEMFSPKANGDPCAMITEGIAKLADCVPNLVLVTNEVGGDGVLYDADTMRYIKNMGRLNQVLIQMADVAIEVVCGIPLLLKGDLSYVL